MFMPSSDRVVEDLTQNLICPRCGKAHAGTNDGNGFTSTVCVLCQITDANTRTAEAKPTPKKRVKP